MKTTPQKIWGRENERKKSYYVLPVVLLTKQNKALTSMVGLFFGGLFGVGWVLFPSIRSSTKCLSFEKSWEGKLVSVIEMACTFAKTKCELRILFGNKEAVKFCEPLCSLTCRIRL